MSLSFCRRSRVEGNNFFNFFFGKMESKWKTNKKNLKNKWCVDISIHISWAWGGGGGGGEQNTSLDNRLLNMSDCLRKYSALLTRHHIVKNVVKKV